MVRNSATSVQSDVLRVLADLKLADHEALFSLRLCVCQPGATTVIQQAQLAAELAANMLSASSLQVWKRSPLAPSLAAPAAVTTRTLATSCPCAGGRLRAQRTAAGLSSIAFLFALCFVLLGGHALTWQEHCSWTNLSARDRPESPALHLHDD